MREATRNDVSDGISWKYPQCKDRMSIRSSSFFSRSRLTLQQWFMMLYFWVDQESVTKASENCEISLASAINIYQWLREVCSTRLIQDGPPQLGGPGTIVEIDESCFRHKPKVRIIHDGT